MTSRAFLSAATRRRRLRSLSSSSPMVRLVAHCSTPWEGNNQWQLSSMSTIPGISASQSLYTSSSYAPIASANQYQCHFTNQSRTFATGRQKPPKKKKGKQDAFKQQLKTSQSSIIGKRPGQTSFSPPKDKTASTSTTATAISQKTPIQSSDLKGSIRHHAQPKAKSTANIQMPLVLPPSVDQTIEQSSSSSDRDNKDHAHTNPSASAITVESNANEEGDSNNPMRNLFLQQGILPPPPRPQVNKLNLKSTTNNTTTEPPTTETVIPEPHPSGVSHANPEDILDMKTMYEPSIHLPDKPNFNSPANRSKYEAGTPMTEDLIAYIGVRGPITVSEFMRRVLRDSEYGYYTSKGSRSGKKASAVGGVGGGVGGDGDGAVDGEDDMEDDNDWDLDDDDGEGFSAERDSTDSTTEHVGGEHVIGSGGDFITAPEVSQLFGESLLVWFMTQYETMNSPSKIQIIEIGPGKGTLICDIVRSAIHTFPDFASALTAAAATGDDVEEKEGGDGGERKKGKVAVGVHLVEVTDGMRARQKESLRNLEKEEGIVEKGYTFQFADANADVFDDTEDGSPSLSDESNSSSLSKSEEQQNTISVSWHDVLSSVPTHDAATGEPIPTFIICQELVDALPIHSFQKIEGGMWRERLVDVAIRDESESSEAAADVRLAVAKRYASAENADAKSALVPPSPPSSSTGPASSESNKKIPRLRFVLPPDTTPALRTILRVNNRGSPAKDNPTSQSLDALPDGSIIEACPEGLLLAQDIADRIEKCNGKGAALIIDYGGDGSSGGDTLRGFWKHTQVHPLSRPGEVDVTADVDFGALREAVNRRVSMLHESIERKRKGDLSDSDKPAAQRPEAFGPITQGKFLAQMGVVQRVEAKIMEDTTTDEKAYEIYSAMERLMAADEMGERYKVLAIAPKKDGLFPPPGF